jgi:hypothetical protein
MGGVCSICDTFRIDARRKCACGALKTRAAMGVVFLRCEWCKRLFAWAPPGWWHCLHERPRCCNKRCRASLAVWAHERKAA